MSKVIYAGFAAVAALSMVQAAGATEQRGGTGLFPHTIAATKSTPVQVAQNTIRPVQPGTRNRGGERGLPRESGRGGIFGYGGSSGGYRGRTYSPSRRSASGWRCYGNGARRFCLNATWSCYMSSRRCYNKRTRQYHAWNGGRIGGVINSYRRRPTYTRRRNNCMRVSRRTSYAQCVAICRRFGSYNCKRYVRWNRQRRICSYTEGRC